MQKYAILYNPAHTRISFNESLNVALKELEAGVSKLSVSVKEVKESTLAGIQYFLFTAENELNENDILIISRLSFTYALFKLCPESITLTPVQLNGNFFIGNDLNIILKYVGKTNELFTRLMMNLAYWFMPKGLELPKILDPLAGKGTTLYEGLMFGADVYGIEIEQKYAFEGFEFIKRYLETTKVKHSTHTEKVSGNLPTGKFSSTRHSIKIPGKKNNTTDRHFEIISGDSRFTNTYYKKNYFDAIIADLPYGVQHGSKTTGAGNTKQSGITRNPKSLLKETLPEWIKVLRPNGIIILAWNLFLTSNDEIKELFNEHGIKVIDTDFKHRVDQAINRDLIIGRK